MTTETPPPPKGPLSGITVVDLTHVLAGPYCTMVLYDLGARVIKVERPEVGDDTRQIGPFINDKSAYFVSVNRGKESIVLDLRTDAGRDTLFQMLEKADVIVENYRPGTMEKMGIGWDVLKEKFPHLIYAATSGFGHTGPYSKRPAYDMVVQGMGGVMSITGHEGDRPVRVGTSIGDITAGLFTTIGITSALYHRQLTGRGQKIDVAMLDCQIALLENSIARYFALGEPPKRLGSRHPSIAPFQAYEAKDGFLIIAAGNNDLFGTLMEELGAPELATDERFKSNRLRTANVEALKEEMEAILKEQPAQYWLDKLLAAGIPCGPINDVSHVVQDPQVLARNMIVDAADPDFGSIKISGNPIKMSEFEDPTSRSAAPGLDANREEILNWLKQD